MSTVSEHDYTVPALARGLMIMELFDHTRRVLSTQDFAEHLGVTPAAIYRIVQTLTEMGYLHKLARNTYELGPGVLSRGFAYLSSRDLVDVASLYLKKLCEDTSMSCHLAIRDGRETVYIYRVLAAQRMSVNVPMGTRLPCHATALGRVLLAALDDEELGQLYYGVQLDGYPRPTPQSLPELRQRLEEERSLGVAVNQSDYATALATAIRNHTGQVVGAINLSGPDRMMQHANTQAEVTQTLLATAQAISHELGYPAYPAQKKRPLIG